jgi:hypothetical protein
VLFVLYGGVRQADEPRHDWVVREPPSDGAARDLRETARPSRGDHGLRGLSELTGSALARFRRQALFNREVKIREQYDRFTPAATSRIGDREMFVLEAVAAGVRTMKLFFDARTGLLVRQTVGANEIDFVFSLVFREIKHNVPIDESKWMVPNP